MLKNHAARRKEMENVLKWTRGLARAVADYLALEHNVTIASAAVFLPGSVKNYGRSFCQNILKRLVQRRQSLVSSAQQKTFSMLVISIRADLLLIVLAGVGFSNLHYTRIAWLPRLSLQHFMGVLVCRSCIGDGLAKHGVACNFRRYRRLPASRATSNGIHHAIDLKTCAYSDRADYWRCADRVDGLVNGVHVGLLITLALAALTIDRLLKLRTPDRPSIRSTSGAFGNHFTVY